MKNISLINPEFGVLQDFTDLYSEEMAVLNPEQGLRQNVTQDDAIRLKWVLINIVVSGESSCTINDKEYTFRANDIVMILPGITLKRGMKTHDFSIRCLCVSRNLMEKSIPFSVFNYDTMSFIASNPIIHLSEDEFKIIYSYYELFTSKLSLANKMYQKESMTNLMRAFMFDIYALIVSNIKVLLPAFSQGNNLFRGFMNEVFGTFPRPRSVSYYAEKLNVTPKYLSAVCKAQCGSTASDLIHKAVIRDVHDMLTETNKSIKEIMVELDFPSLSFFGKYVKKHFGMGPKEYRAKHLSQNDIKHHH